MNHQKMISKCLFAAIALWSVQWTIVSASASPPPAQSANEIPASPTRLNENAAVKQLLQQFEITFNARNLDAFLKLYVKATEPAEIVLLRGEVPLDLVPLEEPQQPQQIQRPPTPIPAGPESFEDFGGMLGAQAPIQSNSFIPFSGASLDFNQRHVVLRNGIPGLLSSTHKARF
jgi:hypothetical protein